MYAETNANNNIHYVNLCKYLRKILSNYILWFWDNFILVVMFFGRKIIFQRFLSAKSVVFLKTLFLFLDGRKMLFIFGSFFFLHINIFRKASQIQN